MHRAIFLLVFFLMPLNVVTAQEANVIHGQKVYGRCIACHDVENARSKMGPHLMGLIGRPVGSLDNYTNYSDAMVSARQNGMIWSEDELVKFLSSPKKAMPGTSMRFFGLWRESDILDLIAYLKTIELPSPKQ